MKPRRHAAKELLARLVACPSAGPSRGGAATAETGGPSPDLHLSPGQREEIDRVLAAYPHLTDDNSVTTHRNE